MQESGPGNAIVGAYLNKLGLTYQAIAYLTVASPVDLQWLHSDDAKRLGIAAGELSDLNLTAPLLVEKPGAESKLSTEATTFVINFYNQWSALPKAKLLSELAIEYADSVDYYGSTKTVKDVLAKTQHSLQRWPIQNYEVRLESMTTNCVVKLLECMSTGIVDWTVKSPKRSALVRGSSRFSFYLGKVSPERFVIMRQNTFVLTRDTRLIK